MIGRDGTVTEGSSTNAWIVTKDGRLVTRKTGNDILAGITRQTLLEVVRQQGLSFEERSFTLEEALEAREAFFTSSSNFVMPVTRIDGRTIGNGHPGLLTGKLREAYLRQVQGLPPLSDEAAA